MTTLKLCVVGPAEGGKTLMCKLLAEATPDRQYAPTQGLRWGLYSCYVQLTHP
jgi:GTPase SAR1 family protein